MSNATGSKIVSALLEESVAIDESSYNDYSDHSDSPSWSDNWNDGPNHSDSWGDSSDD